MINVSRYFCWLVALYPILSRYASPIPMVTLSECLLLPVWILFFLKRSQCLHIDFGILIFCLYLCCFMIVPLTGWTYAPHDMLDTIGSTGRVLLLYLTIAILGKNLFRLEQGIKYITIVALVVGIYALIQGIAAHFGIYLSTQLPFLPVMESANVDEYLSVKFSNLGFWLRVCSLFNEPAHLCTYLICALVITLFSPATKYKYILTLFFSAICIFSRSSMGIIITLLIWAYYILKNHKFTLKKLVFGSVFTTLGITAGVVLIQMSGIWDYFVLRTFQGNTFGDFSDSTRFYALHDMFLNSDSLTGILFGGGFAEIENYLPGFARVYLYLGLTGLIMMLFLLFKLYLRGSYLQKQLVLVFVILNVGTEILLGPFALLYLCLIVAPYMISEENEKYITNLSNVNQPER